VTARRAAAVSWVAACAYAGELAGPAVIGPLAGATSLRVAMLAAALAGFIAVAGPAAVLGAAAPAGTSPGARSRRSAAVPPATARPMRSR
jgi:hypothetical protein